MRHLFRPWLFAILQPYLIVCPSFGAFVFNITQQGLNVAVNGAGTLNTSALATGDSGAGNQPSIEPAQSYIDAGPLSNTPPVRVYSGGISGPSNFGNGVYLYQAISGNGDVVGLLGSTLVLPNGYISGAALSDSNIYANETISYMGMSPGTYVYIWGSGPAADSLTINIGTSVPEPASLAMIAVPLGVTQLRRRRGRRVAGGWRLGDHDRIAAFISI